MKFLYFLSLVWVTMENLSLPPWGGINNRPDKGKVHKPPPHRLKSFPARSSWWFFFLWVQVQAITLFATTKHVILAWIFANEYRWHYKIGFGIDIRKQKNRSLSKKFASKLFYLQLQSFVIQRPYFLPETIIIIVNITVTYYYISYYYKNIHQSHH